MIRRLILAALLLAIAIAPIAQANATWKHTHSGSSTHKRKHVR